MLDGLRGRQKLFEGGVNLPAEHIINATIGVGWRRQKYWRAHNVSYKMR